MTPSADWAGRAALVLLWLLCWFAGFPLPGPDDSFFAGAALHLAHTGVLANPWIAGWMGWIPGVHLGRFYIQPPFLPWTMAAWMKIFGVSARSLTGFACASGLAAALGLFGVARRLGLSVSAGLLAAGLLSCLLLERGLRPEPAGLAVLLAGQALLLGPGLPRWLAGAWLTCLAAGFHPFLGLVGAAALLMHLLAAAGRGDFRGRWPLLLAGLAGAALAAALVLLATIRGEARAFLHDFLGHSRLVTPESGRRLARFREALLVGREGIPHLAALLLSAAALAAALRTPGRPRAVRCLAGLGLLGALGIAFYAPYSVAYLVAGAALAALARAPELAGPARVLAWAPAGLLLAWGGLQHGLRCWVDARGAGPAAWGAARSYAEAARPEFLLFDAWTLRYVFDFRPPEPAMDSGWAWSGGLPARRWTWDAAGPRDLWVINPNFSGPRPNRFASAPAVLAGHPLRSVLNSRALVVIAGTALPPAGGPFRFERPAPFAIAGSRPAP